MNCKKIITKLYSNRVLLTKFFNKWKQSIKINILSYLNTEIVNDFNFFQNSNIKASYFRKWNEFLTNKKRYNHITAKADYIFSTNSKKKALSQLRIKKVFRPVKEVDIGYYIKKWKEYYSKIKQNYKNS